MANTDQIKKALSMAIVIGLTTSASATPAQDSTKRANASGTAELKAALEQLAAADPAVQNLKVGSGDQDQGDEHASPRAKERVCTKSNPASQKSAICPVSPQ
jgi:hypothetical protein